MPPTSSSSSDDFASLPVDFRECRSRSCADTIREGAVDATQTGLPPTAFTHVVDCRDRPVRSRRRQTDELDCSGAAPATSTSSTGSTTRTASPTGSAGSAAITLDDWESFQMRVDPGGARRRPRQLPPRLQRRSGGLGSIGSDTGWAPRSAWEPGTRSPARRRGQPRRDDGSRPSATDRAIHRDDLLLSRPSRWRRRAGPASRSRPLGRRRSGAVRSRRAPEAGVAVATVAR